MANKISYLSLNDAYTGRNEPVQLYLNKWWICDLEKGLMFFEQRPLCNENREAVEAVRAQYYPNMELLFVKQAMIPTAWLAAQVPTND